MQYFNQIRRYLVCLMFCSLLNISSMTKLHEFGCVQCEITFDLTFIVLKLN